VSAELKCINNERKLELKTTNEKLAHLDAYVRVDNLFVSGLATIFYQHVAQSGADNWREIIQ